MAGLLSGLSLVAITVLLNLLITAFFVLTPALHQGNPAEIGKDDMRRVAGLEAEKSQLQLEQLELLKENKALQEKSLSENREVTTLQKSLISAQEQLNAARSELEAAKNKFDAVVSGAGQQQQQQQQQVVEQPDCDQQNCDCSHVTSKVYELWRALEVHFHYRKSLQGELTEATRKLKRNVRQIPRIDGRSLSYKEFFTKYAKTQTPVVITNYAGNMFSKNWTLDVLKKYCGHASAYLKHFDPKRATWGNLASDNTETLVATFIDQVKAGTAGNAYLFDWGIPRNCPELLETYSIPKYFAADYFQRVPDEVWSGSGAGYKHSWPSLFIGTGDTRSGLHIDAVQSHFWMAMIAGRKRWGVVAPDHVPFLYPDPEGATFEIKDLFDVDVTKYPLASKAIIWEDVLGPGDVIFVPGGSAHQIRNLDTIIAISMNYIDEENVDRSIPLLATHHPRVAELFRSDKIRGLTSKQRDLPWRLFKTYPRGETFDIRH